MSVKRLSVNVIRFFAFLILVSGISFASNAESNTKTLKIDLPKDYKSCEFTLSFAEGGEYSAVIADESGKEYEFGKVDDVTMNCIVKNAKTGSWTVTVTAERSIPKVSVLLNGNADASTTVASDNISVGKDIVGLDVYFRDEYLVASWTDDSVGNVNIRVTNLDNSEVIAKETVDSMYYAVEIPETVKNISVGIVPSSSSTVSNAEKLFTFEVPTYPEDVVVTYPDVTYVNTTDLMVNVTTEKEYSFKGYVNEELVYESYYNAPGTYEVPITLSQEPMNNVALYVIDENGNMFSKRGIFILDTEAPELTLAGDYDNLSTTYETGMIEGTVSDYSSFTINGENIIPLSDGTFQYNFTLHLGENTFEIKAEDEAGNTSEYDVTIIRVEESTDYVMIAIKAAVIILVIVAGIVAINLKNKKEKKNEEEVVEEKVEKKSSKKANKKVKKPVEKRVDAKKINLWVNIAIPFVIIAYICYFVVSIMLVSSDSMAPTIAKKSLVIGNRLAYVVKEPQRGDIITFKMDGETVGKRIIGVAGDTIEFADGDVYLNGELLEEDYLAFDTDTNSTDTFTVPENAVFVLGDNRESSEDSRYWNNPYIETKDIESKVIFIWNY